MEEFLTVEEFDHSVARSGRLAVDPKAASQDDPSKVWPTPSDRSRRERTSWQDLVPRGFPQWLSPIEVADILRLERHTVYRFLRDGELPGTKIGGRWFVSVEALSSRIRGSA